METAYEKVLSNYTKLHEDNIKDDANYFIGALNQFYENFKQPTERKVRNAMIYSISDEMASGVEYKLKAGGGSLSDSQFEALIVIDEIPIYKKYSSDFKKVLITKEEIIGKLKPFVKNYQKIENIIYNVISGLREVALERRSFEDINWDGLDKLNYITTEELFKKIEIRIHKMLETVKKDSPTTKEDALLFYDWKYMDSKRLPEILNLNKKRIHKLNRIIPLFDKLYNLYFSNK